jgi:PhnB protein
MADYPKIGGITPHIVVTGGNAAIEFYKKAFNAVEVRSMPADDGVRLMHALLRINDDDLMLMDDFPEYRGGTPWTEPAGTVIHLEVDDADTWFDRAVSAGATVVMPVDNQFWGARYGQVKDPFGHSWSIGGPLKP